jgi:hypothetical protein
MIFNNMILVSSDKNRLILASAKISLHIDNWATPSNGGDQLTLDAMTFLLEDISIKLTRLTYE